MATYTVLLFFRGHGVVYKLFGLRRHDDK